MSWKTLRAFYPSNCVGCKRPVERGSSIRYNKKTKKTFHNACFKNRASRYHTEPVNDES